MQFCVRNAKKFEITIVENICKVCFEQEQRVIDCRVGGLGLQLTNLCDKCIGDFLQIWASILTQPVQSDALREFILTLQFKKFACQHRQSQPSA